MPTLLISTSVDRVQARRPRLALVTGYDLCWAKRAARRAGIAPGYCPGCRPGPLPAGPLPATWLTGPSRGQSGLEALAGGDPELGEDLPQVPFDGPCADEQLRANLWVRPSVPGKPRDVLLLWGELVAGVVSALSLLLPRGQQLASSAVGESGYAHRGEHVVRIAEVPAGG